MSLPQIEIDSHQDKDKGAIELGPDYNVNPQPFGYPSECYTLCYDDYGESAWTLCKSMHTCLDGEFELPRADYA